MAESLPYVARLTAADGAVEQVFHVWAPTIGVALSHAQQSVPVDTAAVSFVVELDAEEIERLAEQAAAAESPDV